MNSSLLKNQHTLNLPEINDSIPVRKIRIVVSDPYATESSSDDEEHRRRRRKPPENSSSSPKRRRFVHEIFLPFNDTAAAGGEKSSTEEGSSGESTTAPPALKRFRGVRQRKSGSWSAEIRDPFKKRRVFLGTFGTGEEASRAYEDKKMEFRERLEAQSGMDRARPTGCGSGTDSSSQSGEQIEQIEAARVLGSILIDNNGFLLGEFSNLDDDLTIPD